VRFLYPAAHFQRRDTLLGALFVLLFGAFLDVFQQGINVPVFGVVVLDIASLGVAKIGHPVVCFAGGDDDAVAVRIGAVSCQFHQLVCRFFR
jgi:hypothetical protein